jgi:hypothetical protein
VVSLALAEEWPLPRRIIGLAVPVILFTGSWASTAAGSPLRRVGLLPFGLVVAVVLYAVPAAIALPGVRLGSSVVVCVAAWCASVPVALVSVERSDHSTAGLLILWVPYISGIAAITLTAVDWYCRRWLRQKAK